MMVKIDLPVALTAGLQQVLSQWMWLSVCRRSKDYPVHWLLRRGLRARQWPQSDLYRNTFIYDKGKVKILFSLYVCSSNILLLLMYQYNFFL